MKKSILKFALILFTAMFMSSCYTYSFTVGNGPQTGVEVKEKNHYFIAGLAQGNQSDIKEMAGGAKNYKVTIQHTFVDGLLNALTWGIYTPTTTTVQK